jgi:metal-sulfur cluster biosynthetic enzyme
MAVEALEGVSEAVVDIVWEPRWNPEMISPEGRIALGME